MSDKPMPPPTPDIEISTTIREGGRDTFDEQARTFNSHGGIRGLADEIDALRAEAKALSNQIAVTNVELADTMTERDTLRAENERLRAALRRITDQGKVCAEFELCTHVACQSSYEAWSVADAALKGETPESANERAIREFGHDKRA